MPIISAGDANFQEQLDLAVDAYNAKVMANSFNPYQAPLPNAGINYSGNTGIDYRSIPFSVPSHVTPDEVPYFLAAQQDNWQRLGTTALNLAPNILWGIAEGIGYLGELPSMFWKGSDFSNSLTEFAKGKRNMFGDVYEPVYGEGVGAKVTDPAWWIVNGGGLVESIAEFGLLGGGIGGVAAKGAKGLAHALSMSAKGARTTMGVAQGATAFSTGYMEGAMSAAEVYKQVYEHKLAQGLSFEVANKEAASAAATTARLNTAIIGALNLGTVAPLFRTAEDIASNAKYARDMGLTKAANESMEQFSTRVKSLEHAEAALKDRYKIFEGWGGFEGYTTPFSKKLITNVTESGKESIEELMNVVAESEGRQQGGIEDEKNFLRTIIDSASSEEGMLSMMLGALGGLGESQIIRKMPVHKYQETERVLDAEGKPISKPVGSAKWVSSDWMETKEGKEKFERFKKSVVDDWTTFRENQEVLSSLSNKLKNASDEESEAIRLQIELAKQNLFNFSAYTSLQNGTPQTLIDMLTEIEALDNEKMLDEELNKEISALEAKAADPNLDSAAKKIIEGQIVTLQTEAAKLAGMTAAMQAGVATAPKVAGREDDYKEIARKKKQTIKALQPVYNEMMSRYNYGDEYSYGLAKYAFLMKAEKMAVDDIISDIETKFGTDINLDGFVATLNTKYSSTDVAVWLKNEGLKSAMQTDMKNTQRDVDEIETMLSNPNANLFDVRQKMAAMGIPTSDLHPDVDAKMLRKKVNDYMNTYLDDTSNELKLLDDESNEALKRIVIAKATKTTLPDGSEVDTYDLEAVTKDLEKSLRVEMSHLNQVASAKAQIKNLKIKSKFLEQSFKRLTSAEGRKQFIKYAQEQIDQASAPRTGTTNVNNERTVLLFKKDLVAKGYTPEQADQIVNAMLTGTAPENAALKTLNISGYLAPIKGKRYVMFFNKDGKVALREKSSGKKSAGIWAVTQGDTKVIPEGSKERNYVDKTTKKPSKKVHKEGAINVYDLMARSRVLSVEEAESLDVADRLGLKRKSAIDASKSLISKLTNDLDTQRGRLAHAQLMFNTYSGAQQAFNANVDLLDSKLTDILIDVESERASAGLSPTNKGAITYILRAINGLSSNLKTTMDELMNEIALGEKEIYDDKSLTPDQISDAIDSLHDSMRTKYLFKFNSINNQITGIVARIANLSADVASMPGKTKAKDAKRVEIRDKFLMSLDSLAINKTLKNPEPEIDKVLSYNSMIIALKSEMVNISKAIEETEIVLNNFKDYRQDMLTLPFGAFESSIMSKLKEEAEVELLALMTPDYVRFMDTLSVQVEEAKKLLIKELMEEQEFLDMLGDTNSDFYMWAQAAAGNQAISDYANSLAATYTPPKGLEAYMTKLKYLMSNGLKIKSLDDFIKGEEVLAMQDLILDMKTDLGTTYSDLMAQLQELERLRDTHLSRLVYLVKDMPEFLDENRRVIFETKLADMGITLDDGKKVSLTLLSLSFGYKDRPVVLELMRKLRTYFENKQMEDGKPPLTEAEMATAINDALNDLADPTYLKSNESPVKDFLTSVDDLQSEIDRLLATPEGKQTKMISLLAKIAYAYRMGQMFQPIYNKHLKTNVAYMPYLLQDTEGSTQIWYDKYTGSKKVVTPFTTTGLPDIVEGEAVVNGKVVVTHRVRGIHNMTTGKLLDPSNTDDLKEIEETVAMERWFRYTAAESTRVKVAKGEVSLQAVPIDEAIKQLEDPDGNTTADNILLKELLEYRDKIVATTTNPDEVLATTIIVIPIVGNQLEEFEAAHDALLNNGRGRPWSVLRHTDTLFPMDGEHQVSTDKNKITIAWAAVAKKMRTIYGHVAEDVVTFKDKSGDLITFKDEAGTDINSIRIPRGYNKAQRYALINSVREQIALQKMKEEYDAFIANILHTKGTLLKVTSATNGINFAVKEEQSDGSKKLKLKKLSDFAADVSGAFTGKLKIADTKLVEKNPQVGWGQVIYLKDGRAIPTVNATFKDLDDDTRNEFYALFIYAMLTANSNRGVSLSDLTVDTIEVTSRGTNYKRRNDDVDKLEVPLFPQKDKTTSILQTFLNYGRVFKDGNADPNRDQIFVSGGKIVFIKKDADGKFVRNEIAISNLLNADGTISLSNIPNELLDYLGDKRINVNKNMLERAEKGRMVFMPKLATAAYDRSTGKIKISNKASDVEMQPIDYLNWLSENVLKIQDTTEALKVIGRTKGQVNFVFTPARTTKSVEEKKSNTSAGTGPFSTGPSVTTGLSHIFASPNAVAATPDLLASFNIGNTTPIPKQRKRDRKKIYIGKPADINLTEARENIREIFGDEFADEHFETTLGLINNDAVGEFTSAGKILMSSLASKGDEYHEAFHRVWRLFVPTHERNKLIKEFKRRSNWQALVTQKKEEGYYDLNEEELIEEILAEDFREHALGRKTRIKEATSWFKKLWDFIKSFLAGSRAEQLFDRILQGDFRSQVAPKYKGKAMHKRITTVTNRSAQGYTYSSTEVKDQMLLDISDDMIGHMFRKLRDVNELTDFTKSKIPLNDLIKDTIAERSIPLLRGDIAGRSTDIVQSTKDYINGMTPAELQEARASTIEELTNYNFGANTKDAEHLRYLQQILGVNLSPTESTLKRLTNEQLFVLELIAYRNWYMPYSELMNSLNGLLDNLSLLHEAFNTLEGMITGMNKNEAIDIIKNSPFVNRIRNYAKSLRIDVQEEIEYMTEDTNIEADEISRDVANYKVSFELDSREKISGVIKLLISTISGPESDYIFDVIRSSNWNKNTAILINHFADNPAKYGLQKLLELADTHPQFEELVQFFTEIDDNNEVIIAPDKLDLFNKFVKGMNNHNYDMSFQMIREEGEKDNKYLAVYPANANVNSTAANVAQEWKEKLQSIVKDKDVAHIARTINLTKLDERPEQLRQAMITLGIPVPEALFAIIDDVPLYKKLYATAPLGGTSSFEDLIINLVTQLKAKNPGVELMFSPTSNIAGTINKITEILAQANADKALSIMNGQNKMWFTVNQHSYITSLVGTVNSILKTPSINNYYTALIKEHGLSVVNKIRAQVIQDINDSQLPGRARHLISNEEHIRKLTVLYELFPQTFMTGGFSLWKKRILEWEQSNPLPVKVVIKDSLKASNSRDANHMSEVNLAEMSLVTLSSNIYGQFKSIQHADRAIFYFYETPLFRPYSTSYVKRYAQNGYDLGMAELFSSTANHIVNYIIDEIELHHKINTKGSKLGMVNGLKKLGSKEVYNGLFQSVGKELFDKEYVLVDNDTWKSIVSSNARSREDIRKAIGRTKILNNLANFLSERSNAYVETLKQRQLLGGNGKFNIKLLGINPNANTLLEVEDHLDDPDVVENIARVAWVNQLISHIEEVKFFTGPAALYGNAANLFKRMVTDSSTGDFLVVTKDTIQEINDGNSRHGITYKDETGFMSQVVATEVTTKSSLVANGVENSEIYTTMLNYYTTLYTKLGYPQAAARAQKEAHKYASAYESMNENDGMSWINPFAYRAYQLYNSEWTPEMDNSFDFEMFVYADAVKAIENNDEHYTPLSVLYDEWAEQKGFSRQEKEKFYSEIFEPLTTLKPQYSGPLHHYGSKVELINSGEITPTKAIRKTAFDYLSPIILRGETPATRTKQFEMLQEMITKGIDVVFMESGAKVGTTATFSWYDDNGNFNANAFNAKNLPNHLAWLDWSFMKDQQKIDTEQKEKVIDSSQARKNIVAGMMHEGVPIDYIFSHSSNDIAEIKADWENLEFNDKLNQSEIFALHEEYRDIRTEQTVRILNALDEELGFSRTSGKYEKLDKIIATLRANAENRNYGSNVLDQIENIIQTGYLESLPNRKRVESLLTSIISNKALRQKRFGTAVPQVTATGMEPINVKRINNESPLDFYMLEDVNGRLQTKASEVIMPIPDTYLKQAMKYYNTNNPFLAVDMFNADIKKGNIEVKMMALRIPNQQLSSNDWVVPAKFYVPIKNNYVYVASETTVKVGSDFDIDKLQIYFPQLKSDLKQYQVDKQQPTDEDVWANKSMMEKVNLKGITLRDLNNRLIGEKIAQLRDMLPIVDEYEVYAFAQISVLPIEKAISFLNAIVKYNTNSEIADKAENIIEDIKMALQAEYTNQFDEQKETVRAALITQGNWLKWSVDKALENRLLEVQGKLLTHPLNRPALLKPIDSKNSQDIATSHGISTKIDKFTVNIDPQSNIDNAVYFVQGKVGIGIVATSLNAKAILMNVPNAVLNDNVYSEFEGRSVPTINLFSEIPFNFNTLIDEEGTITLDSTSEVLTLQVDNVKLLISTKLGFNIETLGLTGFLLNTGVSLRNIVKLFKTTEAYTLAKETNDAEHVRVAGARDQNFKFNYVSNLIEQVLTASLNRTTLQTQIQDLIVIDEQQQTMTLNYERANALRKLIGSNHPLNEIVSILYQSDLDIIGGAYFDLVQGISTDNKSHKNLLSAEKMYNLRQKLANDNNLTNLVPAKVFRDALTISPVAVFKDVQDKYVHLMSPLYLIETMPEYKKVLNYVLSMFPNNIPKENIERFSDSFINSLVVYTMINRGLLTKAASGSFSQLALQVLQQKQPAYLLPFLIRLKEELGLAEDVFVNKVENKAIGINRDAAKMVNRTLPHISIEDFLDRLEATENQDAVMALFIVSLSQSGINNSPFSFEKILPFNSTKAALFNDTIKELSELPNKEEYLLRYVEWFFKAYPYFNSSKRVRGARQRKGLPVTPYTLTVKSGGIMALAETEILGDTSYVNFIYDQSKAPRISIKEEIETLDSGYGVQLTQRQGVPPDIFRKDALKASISPFFIGYGSSGTSTALYAENYRRSKGVSYFNDGLIAAVKSGAVNVSGQNVFVSVNRNLSDENKVKTLTAITVLLDAGANIIMDGTTYLNKSTANVGEKTVQTELKKLRGVKVEEVSSRGIKNLTSYNKFSKLSSDTKDKDALVDRIKITTPKTKSTINVYWRQAESATSTRILSNLAPRKFTWNGREYGSVEHAYQSNKSGAFDQVTYNAYNNIKDYYIGDIKPDKNTIFVFGSNPIGVNGNPRTGTGGAALAAQLNFGVKPGEKMDNRMSDSGLAYGLTTVTGPGKKRSMTPEQIIDGIKKLYEEARKNPDKQFKVAYKNVDKASLNGYTGLEMIEMFNKAGNIPSNIIFSKEWVDTGLIKSSFGYGKKIRGKSVSASFDNLQLMKDLVVESFIQNPNSDAAEKLLQYENFTHNTNELIDIAFLEGLKLAQKALLGNKNDDFNTCIIQ